MGPALLDLNDCNLVLWHGETKLQSPGYALLRDNRYVFGNDARAAARLQPRDVNTRYWWQLSTEALQPALGPARHTGDLAHAQLQALHGEADKPAELVFAVPGGMQREQLSLLLGIAETCPFAAVGLVNRSVLLGSLYAGGSQLWHLEIQLHQSTLAQLNCSGGEVALNDTLTLPGCGLLQLRERIVEQVAQAFVRQTRFDPRRKAATEQALYDTLPDTLRDLQTRSETNIEVAGYRARIVRSDLESAGDRLTGSVRESLGAGQERVIADPLAALLPGFHNALPHAEVVNQNDMLRAFRGQLDLIVQRETHLNYLTTLPRLAGDSSGNSREPAVTIEGSDQTPTEPAPRQTLQKATHLLCNFEAVSLENAAAALPDGWTLSRHQQGWMLSGGVGEAKINDEQASSDAILGTGDRLQIAGNTFTLINVRS